MLQRRLSYRHPDGRDRRLDFRRRRITPKLHENDPGHNARNAGDEDGRCRIAWERQELNHDRDEHVEAALEWDEHARPRSTEKGNLDSDETTGAQNETQSKRKPTREFRGNERGGAGDVLPDGLEDWIQAGSTSGKQTEGEPYGAPLARAESHYETKA